MKSIFSPDSKIVQVMNRAADLVILNFLYIFSCLPIITIGAASTAMYTVCFQMDTDHEQGILKTYFHSLAENFKQATGIWAPLFLLLCTGIFDIILFYHATGMFHNLYWLAAPVVVIDATVMALVFPLISQFDMPWKTALKNAFLLSLGRFPIALLLAVLNALPVVLFYLNPAVFLRIGFLWILIYFSLVAYLGAKLLKKAFLPLYEKSK